MYSYETYLENASLSCPFCSSSPALKKQQLLLPKCQMFIEPHLEICWSSYHFFVHESHAIFRSYLYPSRCHLRFIYIGARRRKSFSKIDDQDTQTVHKMSTNMYCEMANNNNLTINAHKFKKANPSLQGPNISPYQPELLKMMFLCPSSLPSKMFQGFSTNKRLHLGFFSFLLAKMTCLVHQVGP